MAVMKAGVAALAVLVGVTGSAMAQKAPPPAAKGDGQEITLGAAPAPAPVAALAFDLVLTGQTSAGPNANEELAIRRALGDLVAMLAVRRYVLMPTPVNGGFHVCIEANGSSGYNAIVGELSTYAVRNSRWDILEVAGCG